MAKLVDALCSGRSVRKDVQVRFLFRALFVFYNQLISIDLQLIKIFGCHFLPLLRSFNHIYDANLTTGLTNTWKFLFLQKLPEINRRSGIIWNGADLKDSVELLVYSPLPSQKIWFKKTIIKRLLQFWKKTGPRWSWTANRSIAFMFLNISLKLIFLIFTQSLFRWILQREIGT